MIRRKGDWIAAQVGDEVVMMSVETGNYLALSGVGPRIWELIEQPRTRDELRAILLDEFEVAPADCDAEADAFLRDLEKCGAVEISPEA